MLINEVHLWMNECHTNCVSFNTFMCQMCFNVWYQCMKCINYEWTNFAWFPLLSHKMLSLWWIRCIEHAHYYKLISKFACLMCGRYWILNESSVVENSKRLQKIGFRNEKLTVFTFGANNTCYIIYPWRKVICFVLS